MKRKALIFVLICCATRTLAQSSTLVLREDTRPATSAVSPLDSEPTFSVGVNGDSASGMLLSSSLEESTLSATPGLAPSTPSGSDESSSSATPVPAPSASSGPDESSSLATPVPAPSASSGSDESSSSATPVPAPSASSGPDESSSSATPVPAPSASSGSDESSSSATPVPAPSASSGLDESSSSATPVPAPSASSGLDESSSSATPGPAPSASSGSDESSSSATPVPAPSASSGLDESSSSATPVPAPSASSGLDESSSSATPGPAPSASSGLDESSSSATPGPAPSAPSVSVESAPSTPPSPSSSAPPRPTPPVGREVVVVRVQLMVVGMAPSASELDSLRSALGIAVERQLSLDMVDGDLFSSTSCGSACFQLDFVIASTEVLNLDFLNGTELSDVVLSALLPNSTLLFSSVQLLRNTDPACFGFIGVNYDCGVVNLTCPAGFVCVPASQASTRVPCECSALGNLSNCSGFIASVCSAGTVPTSVPAFPNWVIPTVVGVGTALLACICLMCVIGCACCCYKMCGKSKRTVYLTQGQKHYVPSSSPYTASLYKDDPIVTVRNVSSVDGNGFNLSEQEGERQGEGEWERVRTTSDTFKLGWLKDPVEQDTHDM